MVTAQKARVFGVQVECDENAVHKLNRTRHGNIVLTNPFTAEVQRLCNIRKSISIADLLSELKRVQKIPATIPLELLVDGSPLPLALHPYLV